VPPTGGTVLVVGAVRAVAIVIGPCWASVGPLSSLGVGWGPFRALVVPSPSPSSSLAVGGAIVVVGRWLEALPGPLPLSLGIGGPAGHSWGRHRR
jgi:hypothetical protein